MFSASFELSGTVTAGDVVAVSVAHPMLGPTRTVSYAAVGDDTLDTIAEAVAAAINADPVLGASGTATYSGAAVTLEISCLNPGDVTPIVTVAVSAGPTIATGAVTSVFT